MIEHYQDVKDVSCWNVLVKEYASSDSPRDALQMYRRMRKRGVPPDGHTFPFVSKACALLSMLQLGRQVHGEIFKFGMDRNVYVQNTLIHFYGSCKKVLDACNLFDKMPRRTVVSCNAVITACVENSWLDSGFEYFLKMRNCGFDPDQTTFVVLLSICVESGSLNLGKWVHSQVIGKGMPLDTQLGTALVDMYAKCGSVFCAKIIFDQMGEKNVWTWSAMILGLAQHGFAQEALSLFSDMMEGSLIRPNYVTFLGVLCACSHAGLVEEGYRYFHEMQNLHGIKPMMVHYGAIVDILGRAGRLIEAYNFILKLPCDSDPVLWRTLLSACSIHDVEDIDGVGPKVRKRLMELEPRRGGNLVMVANMYSETGMWEKAEKLRKAMRKKGVKKIAGESTIEVNGGIWRFYSGDDSRIESEGIFQFLDDLSTHIKINDNVLLH